MTAITLVMWKILQSSVPCVHIESCSPKRRPRKAASLELARGDVHRDFKAKTHIRETWRDPLHRTSAGVKKPVWTSLWLKTDGLKSAVFVKNNSSS
jgi:hypothetical protein